MGRYIDLSDSARAYVEDAKRISSREALIQHLTRVLSPHQATASTLGPQAIMSVQVKDNATENNDSPNNSNPLIDLKIPIPSMSKTIQRVEAKRYYVVRVAHQRKTEGAKRSHARQIAIGLAERLMRQVECCQWVLRRPVVLSEHTTKYSFDCALRDIHEHTKTEPTLFEADPFPKPLVDASQRSNLREHIAQRTSSCSGTLTVEVIRTTTFGEDQIVIVLVDLRHNQAHQPVDRHALPILFPLVGPIVYLPRLAANHPSGAGTSIQDPQSIVGGTNVGQSASSSRLMTGSVGGNGLGLGTSTKGGEGGGSESKSKSKAAILEKRAHIEDAKAKLLIAKDIMRALGKRPRTPEPCSPIKKQWTKALTTALSPIKGRMANTFGTSKKKPKPSLVKRDFLLI